MEYRRLGKSGVAVSPLCLGVMMFGHRTSEKESHEIVAAARDAGVNFLDVADVYAKGDSERILGRAIAKDRDNWVLATKGTIAMGDGPNQWGMSRKWLVEAFHNSLQRLGTDYIDIYYLHRDDTMTPIEETLLTLGDLISQGKLRYWGFSNFSAWRIAELVLTCDRLGVPRPVVCQPYYHALIRIPEVDTLPACRHFGIGVASYSPLARGVLSGKYLPGEAPAPDSRAAEKDTRLMQTDWREGSLVIAQEIKKYAESRGMSIIDYAVQWVLNNSTITSIIAGPRTMEQWKSYIDAMDKPFTAEDEAFLDTLVPPGHPSTHGYTDPTQPVRGRVTRT